MDLLTNLPIEMQLAILRLLDVPDILAARQACKVLFKATHERTLWMYILQDQETYLPLPADISYSLKHEDIHLNDYSTSTIESTVRNARRRAETWLSPRKTVLHKLKREKLSTALLGLEFLADRWLVVVYADGALYLYDTRPGLVTGSANRKTKQRVQQPVLRAFLVLDTPTTWTSHSATVDCKVETLFVAVSRANAPFHLQLYEVDLTFLSSSAVTTHGAFQLIHTMISPTNKIIRALNPLERLMIISTSSLVEVVKWDEEYNSPGKTSIRVHPEDLEDLWNGVISAQFMGPYILVFKTRSLELHRYPSLAFPPTRDENPSSVLKTSFSMTFRDVSFSQCSITHNATSKSITYETTLFAYDVIHGLFQYTVELTESTSTSDMPPLFDVRLIGVYPLGLGLSNTKLYAPSTEDNSDPIIRAPRSFSHPHFMPHHPRQGTIALSDSSSRGFVSAHRVGPQGKRAMWVERKRSSTARELQVWSRDPPCCSGASLDAQDQVEFSGAMGSSPLAEEIERRVVFSVQSYDLRDDVICCTFGEVSGMIMLGHRSGDVSILELSP